MAYILGGLDISQQATNSFYKYNPQRNEWKELALFPGEPRWNASGARQLPINLDML